MAEMTALEYLKEKARMTKRCEMACACCLLHGYNNSTGDGCTNFEYKHPEKAIAIVQKWAQEHPRKTFLQDFLEKYPKARLNEKGYLDDVCPIELGYLGENFECNGIFDTNCESRWNQPLEVEG